MNGKSSATKNRLFYYFHLNLIKIKIEIMDSRLPGYADTTVSSTPNHAGIQQETRLRSIFLVPYPFLAKELCVSREANRKPIIE